MNNLSSQGWYENKLIYYCGIMFIDKFMAFERHKFDNLLKRIEKVNSQVNRESVYSFYGYIIQKRLQEIEDRLKKEEDDLFVKICKDFNLTDEKIQEIKEEIENKTTKMYRDHFTNFNIKKSQDTAFPPATISYLQERGINPLSIEIKKNENENESQSLIPSIYEFFITTSNIIANAQCVKDPKIRLHSSFFLYNKNGQYAVIEHELSHLLSMHQRKNREILCGIVLFKVGDINTFAQLRAIDNWRENVENSKYFKLLEILQERQAEILHKSPEAIEAIRVERSNEYYPGHLYLSHYADVAEIDELYKALQKIKKLQEPLLVPINHSKDNFLYRLATEAME